MSQKQIVEAVYVRLCDKCNKQNTGNPPAHWQCLMFLTPKYQQIMIDFCEECFEIFLIQLNPQCKEKIINSMDNP